MKTIGCLNYNWVNSSIHDLLERYPDIIARHRLVWITSFDSMRDVNTSKIVSRVKADPTLHARSHGQGMIIPGHEVPSLMDRYDLFTGFDELWCFSQAPRLSKPEGLSIVLPRQITEVFPPGLDTWMNESGCVLGLGDGVGLNYVTSLPDIASAIEDLVRQDML